jgi:hypothetical protein
VVARYRTGYPYSAGRWVDAAHDEVVIALEVVPGVASALGLPYRSTMRVAAQRQLTAFLVQANAVADVAAKVSIVAELGPLADAIDMRKILDQFRAGRPLGPMGRIRYLGSSAVVVRAQLRTLAYRVSRLA